MNSATIDHRVSFSKEEAAKVYSLVTEMIRESSNRTEAALRIKNAFSLSFKQAVAILDIKFCVFNDLDQLPKVLADVFNIEFV